VARWVIGFSDPQIAILSVLERMVNIGDTDEDVEDWSKKLDGSLYFLSGVISFNLCGNSGNINALGTDLVTVGNHRNICV